MENRCLIHHVPYGQGNSFHPHCWKVKIIFFNIIIAMSKCNHPIIFSNTIQLINDLISNTEYQVKLNSFKIQRCGLTKEYGKDTVGKKYWSGFMKRNGHRFNHARPHKFGLDITNWCKYGAFVNMYDSIEIFLIE